MRRRDFMTLAGASAVVWPLAAHAQQPARMPVVGMLGAGTPASHGKWVAASVARLQELGWTDRAYSQFYATATLIGGLGGMLIGGILIDKFGKIRMLNIYFFLLIALTAGLAFLKAYWSNKWFISSFMITYQLLYVFATIGVFATAMQCCWKKVSATQFTMYMTIANVGRIVGAKSIGPIKSHFSWKFTIIAFALMMALAWVLIRLIHLNRHVEKVNELEKKDHPDLPAVCSRGDSSLSIQKNQIKPNLN